MSGREKEATHLVSNKRVHSWRWPLLFARRWSHLPRGRRPSPPPHRHKLASARVFPERVLQGVVYRGGNMVKSFYRQEPLWEEDKTPELLICSEISERSQKSSWGTIQSPSTRKERRTTLQSTRLLSSFGKQRSDSSGTGSGRGRGNAEWHRRQQLCPRRATCFAGCSHKSSHFAPLRILL